MIAGADLGFGLTAAGVLPGLVVGAVLGIVHLVWRRPGWRTGAAGLFAWVLTGAVVGRLIVGLPPLLAEGPAGPSAEDAAAAAADRPVGVVPPRASPPQGADCPALRTLHAALDLPALQRRAEAGEPLTCQDAEWFAGLSGHDQPTPPHSPAVQARMLEWLQWLRVQGVAMNQRGGYGDACLLDRVIRHHSAEIVLFALDAGCDPQAVPTGSHDWPVVARWAVRKHRALAGCADGVPLTPEQITRIDARLPPPSAAQINRGERGNGYTLFRSLDEFTGCRDGGAAFFRHLVEQGGDLGHAADGLAGRSTLHPDLADVLQALGPAQVRRLSQPLPRPGFEFLGSRPLLAVARERGNLPLAEVLCERAWVVEGC